MNFEFMKGLGSLDKAFGSCANAEELALSKPDLSMISSRKSAEVLAKFVFLVAHSEDVGFLSFADVLSDPVVKRYLNSTAVIDAFHFIRKKGNAAVHTLEMESADSAMAVLQRLHFVAGEVAKRMGLISSYPKFNAAVVRNDNAQLDDVNVDALTQEMYDDYILSKNRVERLMSEFSGLCSTFHFIPGDVDLNECIEFKSKPKQQSTITYIQEHFAFMAIQAIKAQNGMLEDNDITYSAELTIYGKDSYTTTDLFAFVNGIMYDLPKADGFKITSIYYGPSVAPWFNDDVREEFRRTVERIDKCEQFTYTVYEFLYNHGEGGCSKYQNGKWVDLKAQYKHEIIDCDFGNDWWCWNLDLDVDFDYEEHPEILAALQQAVRKHIPADQVKYCESAWEDGDVGILINSITWCPRTLRVVQDFLDEVNKILGPIKAECSGFGGECGWYQPQVPFAEANWDWDDEKGFVIGGTCL